MIKLSHVTKTFDGGKNIVVNEVSFSVNKGKTLALLGSSGCGKTTTLKMINRLVEPTSGAIEVDGVDIQKISLVELRRSIGYVVQGVGLFPHMSIEENIAIVLRLQGISHKSRLQRAHDLLSTVNLEPTKFAKCYPHELSGGQQQRVGVARALASDPDYLLMDEPFSALDAITRDKLQQEIIELRNRLHKTIVFVTHDIFEAARLGDEIAVMHKGYLEQVGSHEELMNQPATDFVRQLFARPAAQAQDFIELPFA